MAKKNLTLEEKLEEAIVKDGPYEVPGNWVWTTFDKIVNINPKKINVKELDDSIECSFIPMNIVDNEFGVVHETEIKRLGEVKKGYTNFSKGDVIFAKITPCMENRKSAIVPKLKNDIGYGSTEFHVFRTDSRYVDNRYIFYFIRSHEFISDATAAMTGAVGQQRVQKSFIDGYKVPFPPLKEQQRIVDRIESLFEKLDKAKELIEEAREGFWKRKIAILEKAFRGELTKDYRFRNNISYDWNLSKLKNVTQITSGGTPSRKIPEYFEGKIPWVKTGEIVWNDIYDSEEHITQDAIDNSSAKLIPSGAVLVAMYGQGLTRGRAAILLETACTNQAVCALIPTEKIKTRYLYYYFMKNYWNFRQLAKGGNQENLSGKVIGEFEIEIPSIEEQNEIIRILDDFLEEESKIDELTQLEEQIELIKKSILAKAFRGELGTNCEEDESALVGLKEIISKT